MTDEDLFRVIDRLGLGGAYRNDPIVYNAFQLLQRGGMSLEEVLAVAVKTLSDCNDRLKKDMMAMVSSRPIGLRISQRREASGE